MKMLAKTRPWGPGSGLAIALVILLLISAKVQAQWSKNSAENDTVIVVNGDQTNPAIVSDGTGGAIIVWEDNRFGSSDIYAKRIRPSGRLDWAPNGEPVANLPDSDQKNPAIASDNQNGVFIAWQDERNFESVFNIFAQKIDVLLGNGLWQEGGVLVQSGNNHSANIIRNSVFGAIISSYTSFENNFLIYLQKVNNNGATQWDPFTKPSSQVKAPQPNHPLALVSDDNQGVILAWADQRDNQLRVYAARLNSNGQPVWPTVEVVAGQSLAQETQPAMIQDGAGGAIIVWIQPEVTGSIDHIKAQRLDAQGELQWGPEGKTLSESQGLKRNIALVRVNADTSLALWEDLSSGQDWDIAAQRFNRFGDELEPEFEIVSALGDQINPALIPDKRNGVIISWEDNRSVQTDIYAQLVEANGTTRWGTNGLAVSTQTGIQQKPALIDDNLGGAIIVWEDRRSNTNWDIYAQKVSAPGELGEFRTIEVAEPTSDTNWEIGSKQVVRWSFKGEIDSVTIELSRNGGQTYSEVLLAATANIDSAILSNIPGPATNNAKIRISAVNAEYIFDESNQTFTISAQSGPTLQPQSPVSLSSFGDSILVQSTAQDVSGINVVHLHYRRGGETQFDSLQMQLDSTDLYIRAIPAEVVTERGVQYFVSSRDNFGNFSGSDTVFVSVQFDAGVQTHRVVRGSTQDAYRMISAPNSLTQTVIDSLFQQSGFSAYDTTSWRLFAYRNNEYVERDSLNFETFRIEPGQAYWVISSRDRTIDFGGGISLRADSTYTITLQPGWNQIALPFAFPIAWQDILAATGANTSIDGPFLYNGSYDMPAVLQPYEGYFVNNLDSLNSIDLVIPPVASESAAAEVLARTNLSQGGWSLQINAQCQQASDSFNFLGIHESAADDWDALDHTEPPPVGEYISVYFPRKNWSVHPNNYTTDFRGRIGQGQSWIFTVNTNVRSSEAHLSFSGLADIPADLRVVLLDEKLNISQDLRKNAEYVFPTGASGASKQLKLLVGSQGYINQETAQFDFIPDDFVLHQNFPNPFNPATAIRFGLPRAEKVTIKIYDILGREVTTLLENEAREAGFHVVSWKGDDRNGQPVASGVYIYRIRAGTFSQTRKMLLVK